jgi:hypothetical protein
VPVHPSSDGRTHWPVVTSKTEPCSGQRSRTFRWSGSPPSGVFWWGQMLWNAHQVPSALATVTGVPSTSMVMVSPGSR